MSDPSPVLALKLLDVPWNDYSESPAIMMSRMRLFVPTEEALPWQWIFHFRRWASVIFDTLLGLMAAAFYQHYMIGARPTSKALLRFKMDSILLDFILRLTFAQSQNFYSDVVGTYVETALVQLSLLLLTTVSLLFMQGHENDPDESSAFWKSAFIEVWSTLRLFSIGIRRFFRS